MCDITHIIIHSSYVSLRLTVASNLQMLFEQVNALTNNYKCFLTLCSANLYICLMASVSKTEFSKNKLGLGYQQVKDQNKAPSGALNRVLPTDKHNHA